jgi:hypothetical protein
MSGSADHDASREPIGPGPRELTTERARHAVLAVAKAHTLFSAAANSLPPEHRALADEAFGLLEDAVRDLRDVVARLEGGEPAAADIRAREERS